MTSGGMVKIEEKPEVRKAGGVYYTPTYIVDYIVKNTVGKMLEENPIDVNAIVDFTVKSKSKSAKKKELAPSIRILDPACGSGSFLLGAYNYLLQSYLQEYSKDAEKVLSRSNLFIYQISTGVYALTTHERKRILLEHIYGVDIDEQAVEVAKLNLMLKCLEGEAGTNLKLSVERILPDLSDNIKCGNSLIGTDFNDGLFSADDKKINPFDWSAEFPNIMKSGKGGFDVVIGNPPYGAYFTDEMTPYLKTFYKTHVFRGESYMVFIEKAVSLLRNKGLFGYIVPDTYLNLAFTKPLRNHLLQNSEIKEIILLPSNVFESATVDTTLLFVRKSAVKEPFIESQVAVKVFDKRFKISTLTEPKKTFSVSTKDWHTSDSFNLQTDNDEAVIISRIEKTNNRIAEYCELYSGIKSYEVGKGTPPQTEEIRDKKPFTSEKKKNDKWSPLFDGKHIGRYKLYWDKNNWISYGSWLAAPRDPENFIGEKILIRKIIGDRLICTYVPYTSYCNTLLFVLKIKNNDVLGYPYLLGILNSKFIAWYFRKKFQISIEDTFPQIMIRDILQFPIPILNNLNLQKKIVSLVDRMLTLNKELPQAKTPQSRTQVERQIAHTDNEIDRLVYELYGLSEEEIKVVEGERVK